MSDAETYARLTSILQKLFEDRSIQATPELTADDVDGWDSFAHLRFIALVETEFAVRFSASEIGSLESLKDLALIIGKHQTAQ